MNWIDRIREINTSFPSVEEQNAHNNLVKMYEQMTDHDWLELCLYPAQKSSSANG